MQIEPQHPEIPIKRQAQLLGISRSSVYHRSAVRADDQRVMRLIDEIYLDFPYYGSRRMARELTRRGHRTNRKRAQRLMRLMGLEAIYPKPNLSRPHPDHQVYPYLLRGVTIDRPNQVWSADITYIPLSQGWAYLVAVIDWRSRYVLAWELSTSLESDFCQRALRRALGTATPDIFNTDQGCQFTAAAFCDILKERSIRISMDGRGRAIDNIFIERLWRSVKYEEVYLRDYATIAEARLALTDYFDKYNLHRLHQSLGYLTPAEVHFNQPRTTQQAA